MRSFDEILTIAAARKGSAEAVLAGATPVKPAAELAAIPGDRWLASMARGIFQAGISWTVVDAKWPGIEAAFSGFDVGRVSMMDDAWFDALLADTRVIRSGPKIAAIRDNAAFIRRVDEAEGGFARRIADWPVEDYAGLLDWLTKNGSRLGGNTGAYLLRWMGKESFILSQDVVARLVAEGVVDTAPKSKKSMLPVQAAFNQWRAESGRSFNEIGRVLAQSIG
ncbi:MAG: 3-methyladenine DNA glycosylase [Rhodobacterales bacterium 65-51]|uniref:DNA-3-methyladenine glycosylase I n=1 Tax=uncultured Gemmobacter sp. TaxID=1095917 RepID=UPI000965826B|nr:DNA-3-methyladenine glycosylase I [uncultured Gemmobacter sp.]OJY34152.1 MAG: 3-methyladenine DNA glycosylase [Rhodobacterales bacterium 65-51]